MHHLGGSSKCSVICISNKKNVCNDSHLRFVSNQYTMYDMDCGKQSHLETSSYNDIKCPL